MDIQDDMQAFEKYYKPIYFREGIKLPYPIVLVIKKPEFLKAIEKQISENADSKDR